MNTCSDAQASLDAYIAARDKLLASMETDGAITYLEIRSRRVQFSDPGKMLGELEKMIRYYTNAVAACKGLSQRNRGKFVR